MNTGRSSRKARLSAIIDVVAVFLSLTMVYVLSVVRPRDVDRSDISDGSVDEEDEHEQRLIDQSLRNRKHAFASELLAVGYGTLGVGLSAVIVWGLQGQDIERKILQYYDQTVPGTADPFTAYGALATVIVAVTFFDRRIHWPRPGEKMDYFERERLVSAVRSKRLLILLSRGIGVVCLVLLIPAANDLRFAQEVFDLVQVAMLVALITLTVNYSTTRHEDVRIWDLILLYRSRGSRDALNNIVAHQPITRRRRKAIWIVAFFPPICAAVYVLVGATRLSGTGPFLIGQIVVVPLLLIFVIAICWAPIYALTLFRLYYKTREHPAVRVLGGTLLLSGWLLVQGILLHNALGGPSIGWRQMVYAAAFASPLIIAGPALSSWSVYKNALETLNELDALKLRVDDDIYGRKKATHG